jgi:hypothetical protein
VHVVCRPDGGDLVIDRAHFEQVMKDVFGVFEDHPELLDDLCALYADPAPARDPHDVDQPSRDDVLAQRIVAALPAASTTIRLHRNPLTHLGDAIDRALGRRQWIPRQRGGRAA